MSGKKPARERGARYPLEYIASELGIDRSHLLRECTKAEIDTSNGLKFSEAYAALSHKIEDAKTRRRTQTAEATSAEIDALNKQNLFVFKADHLNIVKDYGVKVRRGIESARYLTKDQQKRLAKELAEIKPSAAEASHK